MATAANQDLGERKHTTPNETVPDSGSGCVKTEATRKEFWSALDLKEVFAPDPGTEDMFSVTANKFAFSPGQLSKLFNPKSHHAFCALGGLDGLEKGLRTDRNTGLSRDEKDLNGVVTYEELAAKGVLKRGPTDNIIRKEKSTTIEPSPLGNGQSTAFADRKRIFGENRLPQKRTKSILELAWIAYNDKVLILLTFAAVVSLALGLYQTFGTKHEEGQPSVEWIEGVAIMVAIIVVVVASTLNDWQMERQFNKLNKKNTDRTVRLIRSGKSMEISVYGVLVGDVMHLSTGDLVPADGIFIQGHGVKCDESSVTGESSLLRKIPAAQVFATLTNPDCGKLDRTTVEKLDPFIVSGSKVNEGTGTFLVTAVGVNSSYGRISMALRTEQEATPLQKKLNILANWIAIVGSTAAALLFVVLFIKFLVQLRHNTATPAEKGHDFLKLFIVSVTVVVVAVPEGLPLAVTLALAFATTGMMKDNNLVRVLKACETMGNATTICSDKTGTLTQNKMTVVAAIICKHVAFGSAGGPLKENARSKSYDGWSDMPSDDTALDTAPTLGIADFVKELSEQTKKMLIEANAINSTAFEGDMDGQHTFIGSKTEVALLAFCRDILGAAPVQELRANADIVQVVPFDSAVKYMATVVRLSNGRFRAYVKGASEIILSACNFVIANPANNEIVPTQLSSDDRAFLLQKITLYAGQMLRTIASSYRDFDSWPPENALSEEDPKMANFNMVFKDMILVAIFGIKDPLRPTVKDAIRDCQKAGVSVRMVTGDSIETGRAIARECGIYHPDIGGIAMEGAVFRRLSKEELFKTLPRLQVLARSSPEDKRILVKTLKAAGETVAVTGDGTNDAPALKMADIGFAMGIAGTEVAKEASEIILMDDNFASIVKGMMWGRAVNDSVKKFLQFQLTVNVTAVVLTFISAVASDTEESVLNAVQLLWVNLIMDTFAALALATDPPTRSVLDRKPDRKSAPLITLRMCKMVIGQAICQLAITLVLNFGGKLLLGYDRLEDGAKRLNTLVFNTFVWLQIFNEVNNRRLDNKLNIFEAIHKNPYFLIINLIMIGGQVLIIFVGKEAFKIVPLNAKEWGLSIGLGALSLPWGALIRLLPDAWAATMIPSFIEKKWERGKSQDALKHEPVEGFAPPLRAMSAIRGSRVEQHVGFRKRIHNANIKAKQRVQHQDGNDLENQMT